MEALSKSESPPKNSPPRNVSAPPRKSSLIKDLASPPKDGSPPKNSVSSPKHSASPPKNSGTQAKNITSPPKKPLSPSETQKIASQFNKDVPPAINKINTLPSIKNDVIKQSQKNEVTSPPLKKEVTSVTLKKVASPPSIRDVNSPKSKNDVISPPPSKVITSPPMNAFKFNKTEVKTEETATTKTKKDTVLAKDAPIKTEKLSLITSNEISEKNVNNDAPNTNKTEDGDNEIPAKSGESNGVGDKIRKFEKAAEDASVNAGRLSRPGSVRGRSRTERLGSDGKDDLPPPATPFKDHVFFDLGNTDKNGTETNVTNNTEPLERQSLTKGLVNSTATKWQRNDSTSLEEKIQKPEPQKIIKPEFKPMPSPVDVTIRSPSLGSKLPDQFPSHGTAFRNVASPDPARSNVHKFNEEVNTQNNFKTCKFKTKEKYSVSKGSSYFTRGSEEIWLVKKKDIEEIEERVLDSFRRAGGNLCMRSESMRPSSDSGQSAPFTHATMGRTKRQMYARSESLDPQWAGARAQTLKRQSSVACTCGHDKKTRAKTTTTDSTARPRSRSHGDENNQAHVLDKYETLV